MKFLFIQQNCIPWPVRVMCTRLGISANSYYAWRNRAESKRATANRELLGEMQRIHFDSSGTYGSPRVHAVLRRTAQFVGRSRVEALMRRARLRGLAALPRRVRTTDSRHSLPSFRPGYSVRRPILPSDTGRGQHHPVHEPQRQLLG
jgi:putative transposase